MSFINKSFQPTEITGAETSFEYIETIRKFNEKEIFDYCGRSKYLYSKLTKKWDDKLNSEWILRNYMAIKMIFSSTLLFNSLKNSVERNVRIVEPYLLYYSLLNSCRALLWTIPTTSNMEVTALQKLTHEKIINMTFDNIRTISNSVGEEVQNVMKIAKGYRELFSYRFPANGLGSVEEKYQIKIEDAELICRLLCELAQLNSELIDVSLRKNAIGKYNVDLNILKDGFLYNTNGQTFIDNEDRSRLDKMARNMDKPTNLFFTISDGQIEDFFGAWDQNYEGEPNSELFNPNVDINIFFSPM